MTKSLIYDRVQLSWYFDGLNVVKYDWRIMAQQYLLCMKYG